MGMINKMKEIRKEEMEIMKIRSKKKSDLTASEVNILKEHSEKRFKQNMKITAFYAGFLGTIGLVKWMTQKNK